MNSNSISGELLLPSGHNFRDIGGYPTADGRIVKSRLVFRSGYMSRITGNDVAQLNALGIDTICDFRANAERSERPTTWHEGTATELWTRNYEFSAGALAELMNRQDIMIAETRERMIDIYRVLPIEQADSYREMFRRIAAGRVPLVFNCSAGKDRTGVASAFLLALLGVSRELIEEDYLLTNTSIDGLIELLANNPRYREFVTARREQALPMIRAEAEYLNTSFAVIDAEHGGIEAYVYDVLGISPGEQDAVRDVLLGEF